MYRTLRIMLGCATIAFAACSKSTPVSTPSPLEHYTTNPNAAFSTAVRGGPYLFLAGKLGTDASGRLVAGGIKAETSAIMEAIKADLAARGLGMERIVKCTAFLVDLAEWGAMNEVYTTYFAPGKRPARAVIGIASLLFGGRVEIECMALA